MDNVGAVAAAMPYNPNKAIEYGEPAYQPMPVRRSTPTTPARARAR
jgi:hypothetical protein